VGARLERLVHRRVAVRALIRSHLWRQHPSIEPALG
jgi:hypothetical protein